MRTLLLFRGAPGCGKSTFIREHGLDKYTLCPDDLRRLYSSPEMNLDGTYCTSQKYEEEVWGTLMTILESRMSRGEFTVIDATCSKAADISKYKVLSEKYRYKIYLIDMTDVPIETCLKRNKMRPSNMWVPDYAIEKIYTRFTSEKVPSGITILKPEQLDEIYEKPIDLSNYKKIVHFGDIHGCYSTLMKYFNDNPFKDDYCYIFCGDYLDRGNENAKTFKFIDSIKDKPNVCLLEGNHERWIRKFGFKESDENISNEFVTKTKPDLISNGITEKNARNFYRKLRQMSHYKFYDKEVLVCHGGIPTMGSNLLTVPTKDLIFGVGGYKDYIEIAANWTKTYEDKEVYLIHGHRNIGDSEIHLADKVFNLDGSIEFGGCLRVLELDKTGFKEIEIQSCQPIQEGDDTSLIIPEKLSVADAITILRNNKFIVEKPLGSGISSFNFNRDAFYSSNWNRQTILARGLFIDTINNRIIARSYEKFFKINEAESTLIDNLKINSKLPIRAYLKENGFLGIISYDYLSDDLFIASKSTNHGEFVGYINKIIDKKNMRDKLKSLTKEYEGYSFVFEVIDPVNDPHIIKYSESNLVLLDVIKNDLVFSKLSYEKVKEISEKYGISCKSLIQEFATWKSFFEFYTEASKEDYKLNGSYIEGFVFEDTNGFMFKLKTEYYNFWKWMRNIAESTFKYGRILKTGALTTPESNSFYAFCKKLNSEGYEGSKDIISLRDKYLNQ